MKQLKVRSQELEDRRKNVEPQIKRSPISYLLTSIFCLKHQFKGSDTPYLGTFSPRRAGFFFLPWLWLSLLVTFIPEVSGQEQIVKFNRSNSAFVDNYINRIVLFNGMPVVCTESGITIVQIDHLETWRRGESGFPDAGVKSAVVYGGKLWVGTYGKGLARLDEGKWKSFTTHDSGLNDNFITHLSVFSGKLFIGTRDGLAVFDGLLWERARFTGRGTVYVTSLTIHRNAVWVGTNRGVFILGVGNKPEEVDLGVSQPGRISAMDSFGGFIFIAFEGGVTSIGPDGRKIHWGSDKLPSNKVVDIVGVENGAICASEMGLFRLTLDGGVQKVDLTGIGDTPLTRESAANVSGFPPISVTAIVRGGGFLWLGIEGGGIIRLPDQLENFSALFTKESLPGGNQRGEGLQKPSTETSQTNQFPRAGTTVNVEGFRVTEVQVFPPPEEKTPLNQTISKAGEGVKPLPVAPSGQGSPGIPGWGGTPPVHRPVDSVKPVSQPPVALPSKTTFNDRGIPNIPGYSVSGQVSPGNVPATTPSQTTVVSTPGGGAAPVIPGWGPPTWARPPEGGAVEKNQPQPVVQSPQSGGTPAVIPGWGPPTRARPPEGGKQENVTGAVNAPSAAPGLSFASDIVPVLGRNCVPCHTTGTGSFFPMNNLGNLHFYFKKEGLIRFDQARGLGRGMSGRISQADVDLLRAWVTSGAQD